MFRLHSTTCLIYTTMIHILVVNDMKIPAGFYEGYENSDLNITEFYKREIEKLTKDYNPNAGYEPYWPQGGWVFEDLEMKKYGSTTKMPQVCGEECNYLYRRIKKVCGRHVYNKNYLGCHSIWIFKGCWGEYLDDLTPGFKTFDTYCEFLDTQCKEIPNTWIFVHAGACVVPQDDILKPVQFNDTILSRLAQYITGVEKRFSNATLPAPFEG